MKILIRTRWLRCLLEKAERLLNLLLYFSFVVESLPSAKLQEYRPYLVGATIVNGDGSILLEWLEFHRNLGFDQFLLYDMNKTDETRKMLDTYIEERFVEIFDAPELLPIDCSRNNIDQLTCLVNCAEHALSLLRGRGIRWFVIFEPAQFIWPNVFVYGLPQPSVSAILRKFAQSRYDLVNIIGSIFGTKPRTRQKSPDEARFNYFNFPLYTDKYEHRSTHVPNMTLGALQYAMITIGDPLQMSCSSRNDRMVCAPTTTSNKTINLKTIEPLAIGDIRVSHFLAKSLIDRDNRRRHSQISELLQKFSGSKGSSGEMYSFFDAVYDEDMSSLQPALKTSLTVRLSGQIPSRPFSFTEEYDPWLFNKRGQPFGMDHPERIPDICVVFMSCFRLDYLRRAVTAFINYVRTYEPWLTYNLVIVENGSGFEAVKIIERELPIDTLVLNAVNLGIGAALNSAFFGVCRSPYILSLEDDWEARSPWKSEVPALSMAMSVLQHDNKVLEVWLRDAKIDMKCNRTEWLKAPTVPRHKGQNVTAIPVQPLYRRQQAGETWGAYTNGASLKHSGRLMAVGRFVGVNGEEKFAARVKSAGFSSALLCTNEPYQCSPNFVPTESLFQHIGKKTSDGHTIFYKNIRYGSANW